MKAKGSLWLEVLKVSKKGRLNGRFQGISYDDIYVGGPAILRH